MPGAEATPLRGSSIWVTRPSHQATSLTHALQQLGARTLEVPLLDIAAYVDNASQQRLQDAANYDLVVFVSANAVEFSVPAHQNILKIRDIAAIGRATAQKCEEFGIKVSIVPDQADSEGLLALPRFADLQGQRVLIIRGHGGRERLADGLRARGASVDYAEVYERRLPAVPLTDALAGADVILITSSEALANLVTLAQRDRQPWVFEKQLLLIHARIASRVQESGFTLKPLIAAEANDSGMLAALQAWVRSKQ